MTTTAPTLTVDLGARFPNTVSADARPNFKGWIIPKENLIEVATVIRDELGYDLLSSLTGVDYFPENKMEVVYHAYKTTGGPGLEFKVQVPREDPVEVPSLIEVWPGVDLQEREAWDLLGIKFMGHPDLRRILTDYGFIGNPFRKDFPLSGNVEMRYDPDQQRVIYQPVTIEPRQITPRVIRDEHYGDSE
jgi:NADH:ubiquinone oxidoreductase subunit C